MSYGALREPGYEQNLAELKQRQAIDDANRADEARLHISALLRGAKAQEATRPPLERIAAALERIADAQERAFPVVPVAPVI